MMKSVACMALLATSALAAPLSERDLSATATVSANGLSFNGNVTLVDNGQFHFRESVFIDIPLISGAFYSSVSVDGAVNGTSGSAHADGIIGLSYFPPFGLLTFPPTIWMAYFDVSSKASGVPGGLQVSVDGAASLVATAYGKVEEVDSAGKVVNTVQLKDLTWTQGKFQTDSTGNLNYMTFTAVQGKFTISVTLAVSKVVGKLNVGGATITPQSMESFVEMSGYQYAAATNHLQFTMYVATCSAQAAASFSATHTMIAGEGDSQVYLKFSGNAVVDGKVSDVSVSGYAGANIDASEFDNSFMEAQLTANADLKVSTRKVVVSFPAGASAISYDPSMGVKAPNSSALIVPALMSVILAVILALFF